MNISSREVKKLYISFPASPLIKYYIFFTSLGDRKVIFMKKKKKKKKKTAKIFLLNDVFGYHVKQPSP